MQPSLGKQMRYLCPLDFAEGETVLQYWLEVVQLIDCEIGTPLRCPVSRCRRAYVNLGPCVAVEPDR